MSGGKFDVEALERNWKWSDGDPDELFVLEEEIASGSFGSVYKVRPLSCSFWSLMPYTHSPFSLLAICYRIRHQALRSHDTRAPSLRSAVCPCVTPSLSASTLSGIVSVANFLFAST